MQRTCLIAGNWKMHKTIDQSLKLVQEIKQGLKGENLEVLVSPTFVALNPVANELKGSGIFVAGQNLFWEEEGAYTGEVSGPMLKACGASHVIIGHSERRQLFGETDETVNKRLKAALSAELIPILCIGETLEERQAGRMEDVLKAQLEGGLRDITIKQAEELILAYEPVWAIGTGQTATKEQANQAHAFIRDWISSYFDQKTAESMRILYGGSVKPANANELLKEKEVDGALIGGASLTSENFLGIIRAI